MQQTLQKYFDKAEDSLEEAIACFKIQKYSGTISRAYYSMYDCVEAMLSIYDTYPKSHQGVAVKFSEYFIKTGLVELRFKEYLKQTFDNRQVADYDMDGSLSENDAKQAIESAKAFLEMAKEFCEKHK
jgi:uncharacterized protein (UPF0332 family)